MGSSSQRVVYLGLMRCRRISRVAPSVPSRVFSRAFGGPIDPHTTARFLNRVFSRSTAP